MVAVILVQFLFFVKIKQIDEFLLIILDKKSILYAIMTHWLTKWCYYNFDKWVELFVIAGWQW